jgi:hypothetical protein
MNGRKTSIIKLACAGTCLGVLYVAKRSAEFIEKKVRRNKENSLNRKLAISGILFHLIGIFYNE